MPNYPSKNLTGRPVSSSYVNLTQLVSSSILVDGLGNSIIDISTITASNSSTAIYSVGNANSSNYSLTASYVNKLVGINDYFDKSDNTTVAFATLSDLTLNLQQDLLVYINNTPIRFTSGSTITMPATLLAGNDYGVYATYDNNLIATYTNTSSVPMGGYTIPAGYTTDNSRLIGGFYFAHSGSVPTATVISRSRADSTATLELVAGSSIVSGDTVDVTLMTDLTYNTTDIPATVTGNNISFYNSGSDESNIADTAGRIWKINNTGCINQYSLWDLKFRPMCSDPRGMVLVNNKFWVDIWLTGNNYLTKGSSRKGQRIADGENASSYPLISTKMGGNGTTTYGRCDWFVATEVAAHWEKQLLSYADYEVAAYGTTEQASYGTDNQFTCRASTSPSNNFTSKWGLEQASGVMWIWGSDLNYRFESGTGTYIATSIRSRDSSSVAAITCSTNHNLSVGEAVSITGFTGTAGTQYNRFTTVLSVPSPTSFTYNCASGSLGEGPTSSSIGLVQAGALPAYNWVNQAQSRGQLYIQGPNGLVAGLFGGIWNYGTLAGSRCSSWSVYVWYYYYFIGFRCRCDHTVIP